MSAPSLPEGIESAIDRAQSVLDALSGTRLSDAVLAGFESSDAQWATEVERLEKDLGRCGDALRRAHDKWAAEVADISSERNRLSQRAEVVEKERDAARAEAEQLRGLLALWLRGSKPNHSRDHACRQCMPDSFIGDGEFVCAYHATKSALGVA